STRAGSTGPPEATAGVAQAGQLASIAVTAMSVQTTNIGFRLSQLRGGPGGRPSADGLALTVDGQTFSLGALTSALGEDPTTSRGRLLDKLGLFVNGQGSFGTQSKTSQESEYDFHTGGLTLGVDYRFTDQFVLGVAGGYLRTKADVQSFEPGDFGGESSVRGY